MKRDHPDVLQIDGSQPLRWPAAYVVERLSSVVTADRLARMRSVLAKRTRSLTVVLEDLVDPHNGAAVLRSADAFGCHTVHVVAEQHPFAISHRVSRGTHRWLEIVSHANTADALAALRQQGYQVFIAAMDGALTPEDLARVPRAAVVLGNEHRGVSDAVRAEADGTYAIPMAGFVESLNVSVASAITLYVAARGRQGDVTAEEQEEMLARYLIASVRDAERILEERGDPT